jgi:flagellar biosynthesis/type III secretory pathway protein FliH
VRVNPLDLSNISGALPGEDDRAPVTAGREVRWIPDASIGCGGCVVEGPERIVDGRIEAALERVYRRVTDG